jgi:thiol-disulfide isomerase/thioredoxin
VVRAIWVLALAAGTFMGVMEAAVAPTVALPQRGHPAPAFNQTDPAAWLNSAPLTWEALGGHVVVLEFWTFDCSNCYRSVPWLRTLEPRYGERGLRVVSIHTPEFAHEHVRANVAAKLRELEVTYPVMLDNNYAYWQAFHNRYWPAFYLVDRQGRVRAGYAGETHVGDRNAAMAEASIEALLAE